MSPSSPAAHRSPGALVSFAIAGLFLALTVWVAAGGSLWAIGLGALTAVWAVLGARALRRR